MWFWLWELFGRGPNRLKVGMWVRREDEPLIKDDFF